MDNPTLDKAAAYIKQMIASRKPWYHTLCMYILHFCSTFTATYIHQHNFIVSWVNGTFSVRIIEEVQDIEESNIEIKLVLNSLSETEFCSKPKFCFKLPILPILHKSLHGSRRKEWERRRGILEGMEGKCKREK